jgi:hypothetical protein
MRRGIENRLISAVCASIADSKTFFGFCYAVQMLICGSSLGGLLTWLRSLLDATVGVVHRDGSVLQTCCAMQFTVVRVQLTIGSTYQLLMSPAATLTDTLRHPAAHLALPSFAAVLHQARVCGYSSC